MKTTYLITPFAEKAKKQVLPPVRYCPIKKLNVCAISGKPAVEIMAHLIATQTTTGISTESMDNDHPRCYV